MPKRKTPQARYQSALREIKRRTGATHKEARHAYRIARSGTVRAKFPTYWKELPKRDAVFATSRAKRELQLDERPTYKYANKPRIIERQLALFTGPSEFSFDMRDLDAGALAERLLADIKKESVTLRVEVEVFKRGRSAGTKIVTRENVSTLANEFWYAYHDTVREGLEGFYTDGQGGDEPFAIVTNEITILE